MLNLLFISDSPKVEHIKNVLQPFLKVIIDVVTDFDHGLKDVFEKRPTTVCIQDQIGGVTGESVARHIQMLLGNSAPQFILLYTGNGKAKAINGLYEHVIDLNQSNETVTEEVKNTLKSLLGDQWDKIYIQPKLTPASIISSVSVPEESREDADKLVDDFLSDLETSGFSVLDEQPSIVATPPVVASEEKTETVILQAAPEPAAESENISDVVTPSPRVSSSSDELIDLLLAEANKPIKEEGQAVKPPHLHDESEVVFKIMPTPPAPAAQPTPVIAAPAAAKEPLSATVSAASPKTAKPSVKAAPQNVPQHPTHLSVKPEEPATFSAAGFKISQDISPAEEEPIPEDLLLAFEENYRTESSFLRRSIVSALICSALLAGGWYLVKQKPQLISSLKQKIMPTAVTPQPPVKPSVQPTAPVIKPPPVTPPVTSVSLPSFIPKDGHDSAYAAKNPGWERYYGKNAEFRVFSVSGRLQAVQVVAKNASVPEELIKSVLLGIAGSSEYKITSRNTKAGMSIESGTVGGKGDVMFYKKNRLVKAFVVSLN